MIGKTVSHYKIIEEIGSGGMGVVYKAVDTKLKRTVALKFLPQNFTRDTETKERFIREAQTASSLDHPNICTIYEINETEDGQMFIAMACYEGQTLKQQLADGPLSVDQAINIAVGISQGLTRAHEEGIVHRDIKPANIFVTDRNEVKILDFGLAKLAGQAQITKDSSTLGTVAYMSPEQCSGSEVDQRTDIWSLGVIIYEMVTGFLPFKGEYEQAVIYSILNEEPKSLMLPASGKTDFSMKVEEIVNKALIKNPGERYQYLAKILYDLKSIQRVPQVLPKKNRFQNPTPRFLLITLVVVLSLALISIGYWLIRSDEEMEFRIKHTLPLTTAPGLEQDPTWSPEGTRIAYSSDESGNMDVWVRQIAAGQRVNLTKDHTGYDGKPAWSPDGEWIAFVSEREGGGIFMIPALGGIPKQIVSLSFALSLARIGIIPDVSWSPDGSELTYAIAGCLYTISSSGGIASTVPLPPTNLVIGYSEPAWSPDEERIACTGFVAVGVSTSQIWSLHRKENDPIPVTDGRYLDHSPIWSPDGKKLFFISDRGGNFDIWWIPVNARGEPTGSARPLTTGAGIGAIALSKNGTKLAYTKIVERSNIWSIPIVQNRKVTLDEARAHTSENHYIEDVHISPDGQWIAFDSNRRGNMDIWIMRKDGSRLRPLTTNPAHDWYPQWSQDGKQILFHSMRTGNRDLFSIPVVGGAVTQLTNHPAEDLGAHWSPDGQRIAFMSNRSGNMDLWMMNINSNKVQQLTFEEAQENILVWSPDGKEIVFCTNRTGYYELFRIQEEQFLSSRKEDMPTQITRCEWANVNPLYWTADGKTIFAYAIGGPNNKGANLWAVSTADGSARPLIDFQGSLMEPSHSLFSDDERIYFPLWERIGDLWMAELITEE